MPLLGTVELAAESGPAPVRSNGAQRLLFLHDSLAPAPGTAEAVAAAAGPVLLVDDFTETGWTLAVAARLLRRAGATHVLPLVLAVQG
jgi:ATP-dependent DNA helicase RecQ